MQSEKSINEGSYGRSARQYDKYAEEQKNYQQGDHPVFFTGFQKVDQISD
jgi:hypothetical protein